MIEFTTIVKRLTVILPLLLVVGLAACDQSDENEEGALFLVRACAGSDESAAGQTFHVLVRDPGVIAEARQLINSGEQRIINGRLRRGDGGFNEPWAWHIDPDSISFADFTIELCDGCPGHIEDDLDYWVDTVKNYCPWSTEIISRER